MKKLSMFVAALMIMTATTFAKVPAKKQAKETAKTEKKEAKDAQKVPVKKAHKAKKEAVKK